jgi:hypothetical protein
VKKLYFCVSCYGKILEEMSKVESVECIALYTWELVIRTNNADDENMIYLVRVFLYSVRT